MLKSNNSNQLCNHSDKKIYLYHRSQLSITFAVLQTPSL